MAHILQFSHTQVLRTPGKGRPMKLGQNGSERRGVSSSVAVDIQLFRELVAHLRRNRAQLRKEWAKRICDTKLLTAMSKGEIFSVTIAIYDNYLRVLETGSVRNLQAYARDLSKRIIQRGVETQEVLGIVLLLRDVLARSLFKHYQRHGALLNRVLDAYEPAANRIANTVAVSFVEQRERVIRRQQKAIQTLHVQEEERKRISRELHDDIGQALTAINALLALLPRNGQGERDATLKTKIDDVEKLAVGAMDRMHSFARELRPSLLDDLGLVPALRSYLKEFGERTGVLVRFERSNGLELLDAGQETVLFRIAQESLTNVATHAQATRVDVALRVVRNAIRFRIEDNGKGFDLDHHRSTAENNRLGLLGMQERASLVNGRLVIKSSPGKGTTVLVEIPLPCSNPSAALARTQACSQ